MLFYVGSEGSFNPWYTPHLGKFPSPRDRQYIDFIAISWWEKNVIDCTSRRWDPFPNPFNTTYKVYLCPFLVPPSVTRVLRLLLRCVVLYHWRMLLVVVLIISHLPLTWWRVADPPAWHSSQFISSVAAAAERTKVNSLSLRPPPSPLWICCCYTIITYHKKPRPDIIWPYHQTRIKKDLTTF